MTQADGNPSRYDVIVIGAGFAGMYTLHRLRQLGLRVRVLEAGDGVGEPGTGIAIQVRAAMSKVSSIPIRFLKIFSKNGNGLSAMPRSLKS